MHPELFRLGSFAVPSYGVLIAFAFLAAVALLRKRAPMAGLTKDEATDIGVWILLGGLGGAKLLLLVVDWPQYTSSWKAFLSILRSAGVFYGGLIGSIAVAILLVKKKRLDFWSLADAGAPCVALGQAIGRLGCFAAGCCWGSACHQPWAVTFTNPKAYENVGVPIGIPLHPTQLYEVLGTTILTILLVKLEPRAYSGQTFVRYLLGYAALRGTIEIFRGDPRGAVGPLSTSQLIAILGFVAGLVILALRRRQPVLEPAHQA